VYALRGPRRARPQLLPRLSFEYAPERTAA
jgi:hypothetical protein